MLKKLYIWCKNNWLPVISCTIIVVVATITITANIIIYIYKVDNHQKSDRYYTDENGIQREVKFVKINNYLYYDVGVKSNDFINLHFDN